MQQESVIGQGRRHCNASMPLLLARFHAGTPLATGNAEGHRQSSTVGFGFGFIRRQWSSCVEFRRCRRVRAVASVLSSCVGAVLMSSNLSVGIWS